MTSQNDAFDNLTLATLEKLAIQRALERTGGSRTKTAALLDISVRTLQRKIKEYERAERAAAKLERKLK